MLRAGGWLAGATTLLGKRDGELMLPAQCPAAGHLDAHLASAPMPPREDEDTPRPVHHHLGQHGLQGRIDRGWMQRLDQGCCRQMAQPCTEGHVELSTAVRLWICRTSRAVVASLSEHIKGT